MIFGRKEWRRRLTDSCRRFPLESESDVVSVGRSSVLKDDLPLDHRTGEVLEVLQLVEPVVPEIIGLH